MKRVHKLVNSIVDSTCKQLSLALSEDSSAELREMLSNPMQKSKEDMYNEVTKCLSSCKLRSKEVESVLKVLYEKYFLKYDLIKSCAIEEEKRLKGDVSEVNKLILNIQKPATMKPLKQAKQVHSGQGISLDPSYLD